MLPIGATSNEALRRELKRWALETTQTRHTALLLKLRFLLFPKLIANNAAPYRPTLAQMRQRVLLGRVARATNLRTAETWKEWRVGAGGPSNRETSQGPAPSLRQKGSPEHQGARMEEKPLTERGPSSNTPNRLHAAEVLYCVLMIFNEKRSGGALGAEEGISVLSCF